MKSGTIFIAFLALACAAAAAQTKHVDRTLPLHSNGSVSIDSHNGSITVDTWDRNEIEIHARVEAGGSSASDRRRFDETNVEIEGSGDSVRIKTVMPDWNFSWWGNDSGNSPEVHYTVKAPRTARWTLRDHNSHIELHDLRAALEVSTHNGRLNVTNLAGPLALEMHNGRASVEFAAFTGESHVDTHNAEVELSLPSNSRFNLNVSGHNQSFHSDFSVMTRMSSWHGRRDSQIEGPVNGGGPTLRLSSHNGGFRLRAR